MRFRRRKSWANRNTSEVPIDLFTKMDFHPDWKFGATRFRGRDSIFPDKIIPLHGMAFWNKTLDKCVAMSTYQEITKSNNPELLSKLADIGLPTDMKF